MKNNLVRPLLVLLLMAGMLGAQAQTVWNKTYIANRPVMLFSSILAGDSDYTVIGGTYGAVNNLGKGLVGKINSAGDLTRYKIIVDSTLDLYGFYTNALIKTNNGKIAFTGLSYSSLAYLLFCIADTSLDSIHVFRYYTPNTFAYHGYALIQVGSDYYITGVRTDSLANDPNVILVKIDSAGNRLWEKNYGGSLDERARSITMLNNGHLMIGAYKTDGNDIHEHSHTWLLEVDSAGNFVRQWFDSNDSTYVAEGLKQTQDGGFIYGGKRKFSESGGLTVSTATIVKMDNNFVKQWAYNGGVRSNYTWISDIEELEDGSFVACGNKVFYGIDTALNGWIIKLNAMGQIVWEGVYRGINASLSFNFLNDIDLLPDGTFVAVGECRQDVQPPQVGWFLKLDSNGCEMESCLTTDVVDFGMPPYASGLDFGLNPNPASGSVTVSIDESMLGSSLTIADITGKRMASVPVLNSAFSIPTSAFANGVYLVTVENEKGRMTKKLVKQN